MREALAAADHDFVLAEPASRPKRNRGKSSDAKGRAPARGSRGARRYLGIAASAACAAAIVGILVNALALQKTRHPAPLFARASAPPSVKEPPIAETAPRPVPLPPPAPTTANSSKDKSSIEKLLTDQGPSDRAAGARARASTGEISEEKKPDPISQLLKAPTAPAHEEKPAASTGPSKTIMAAQRALIKLGFVVKPDGMAGAGTRRALEAYERDRGLPAHGELTPSLMRRLSSETGISIH